MNEMAQALHNTAIDSGWWDRDGIPVDPTETDFLLARIALMHSELSEALEEARVGGDLTSVYVEFEDSFNSKVRIEYEPIMPPEPGRKPVGFATELADCIIRILDTCAALGIDIDEAVSLKAAYNKTRPFRHGGKLA